MPLNCAVAPGDSAENMVTASTQPRESVTGPQAQRRRTARNGVLASVGAQTGLDFVPTLCLQRCPCGRHWCGGEPAEPLSRREKFVHTFLELQEQPPSVVRVMYPMLESHPQHTLSRKLFSAGSWLLSFELRDTAACMAFIDRLTIPIKATGLGDTRTLVIPVAPTILWEAGAEVRVSMGIANGLIRLSVGLEDAADLLADFEQALA